MQSKLHRVKDVAGFAGVTVRTLHHYDEIGLLVPSGRSDAGYRLYSEQDLLRLQQILLWREFGLSLRQIESILKDPELDRREMLLGHRAELEKKLQRTQGMIRSVERALEKLEGEEKMKPKQLFDGFDPKDYEAEARERWGGSDAYQEASRRTGSYDKKDWARIKAESSALMKKLADRLEEGRAADEPRVMDLAEEHRLQIDRWYYPCDHQMHAALAEMYVADERFSAFFEKHRQGLTAFVTAAIRANAARH